MDNNHTTSNMSNSFAENITEHNNKFPIGTFQGTL